MGEGSIDYMRMQWADIQPVWLRRSIILTFGAVVAVFYMAMWIVAGPIIAFCQMMHMFTEAWYGRRI